MAAEGWTPSSWREKKIAQQPTYADAARLDSVLGTVRRLPPLVTPSEVLSLRHSLSQVAEGKRFLLQGGDCAERFDDCCSELIEKKLKILLQMSLVLTWGARVPTVRIARLAGQFSKPRSKDREVVDGVDYPAFRGDNVNSFDLSAREPDAERLLAGYFHSAATLNYARALLTGGLGDLHAASHWDLGFVQDAGMRESYQGMVDRILSALDFMRVCGAADEVALKTADVFMSHEGLQLAYEEALTRPVPASAHASEPERVRAMGAATPVHPPAAKLPAADPAASEEAATPEPPLFFNLGTHFLWIGDRTRQLEYAHVEYFRGIENPIGIKAGPSSDPAELVEVIRRLWPSPASSPGKIVIITRMGASAVKTKLPPLIEAVQAARFDAPVVWTCDPMHGNTRVTSTGLKTREFDDILTELLDSFDVHASKGSRLGGVHFELTGENVTECTGGPEKLLEHDLPRSYTTYCDPRLNYAQGMELAFKIAEKLANEREMQLSRESGLPVTRFAGVRAVKVGTAPVAVAAAAVANGTHA